LGDGNNANVNIPILISCPNLEIENIEYNNVSYLFPNPCKDYLEINLKNEFSEDTIAEFYNEVGQICRIDYLKNKHTKIELNDLSSGIYFVKIKTKNETITKKLIKI